MEYCNICDSNYKKSFESDHLKSVKQLEKIGQFYYKKCNLYMDISDKDSHLSSDEQKNRTNKIWCEDCSKYITDKTRHFQSEIHLLKRQHNQQNNFGLDTQFGNGVEIIMNEKTYIKLKINPTENLEYHINELLSKIYFPRYKYQLIYLAKFSKIVDGEEVLIR